MTNHRKTILTVLGLVPLLLTCACLPATGEMSPADAERLSWPGFRGPSSNPVSDNPNLPATWSKTENVEWVAEVDGVGWSSPIVWGNRVFLTSAASEQPMKQPSLGTDFGNDYIAEMREAGLEADELNKRLYDRDRELPHEIVIRLMVYCFDLETGKKLWENQVYEGNPPRGRHRKNSFASETPVTDGELVYVYLTQHGLYAFDFEGNPAWATPLKAHDKVRDYGAGTSLALHGDRLFVLNDNQEESFLAAFDKRTGAEVWRKARTFSAGRSTGWSTPLVWENDIRTEIVTQGPGRLISYGLDGTELWNMKRMAGSPIQSPFAWEGVLYVTSGTQGGRNKPIAAIRPGGSGDITPPEEEDKNEYVIWYNRLAGGTYLPTPVVYDDGLYVLTSNGIFSRLDPSTGERVYRSRVAPGAAAFTASPWAYDGKVFAIGEEGDTYVIEVGEEYKLLGVNRLDEWTLASPAIVGDRLLIRTQTRLYSIRDLE